MKAYGFNNADSPPVFFEQPTPEVTDRDLLVSIAAVAVNPIDTKIKAIINGKLSEPKIIGWDACGTVIATGEKVNRFKTGDRVFYAGDVTRSGCNASHQLVDERIVGRAPASLNAAEAAAMPLTSITAWEALFNRLKINGNANVGKNILIIGGAGGVGSIAIQLAKNVAKLTIIATASRAESKKWCGKMGADYIINHRQDMVKEYLFLKLARPDYILCANDTDQHFAAMVELIAPQGMICGIVDTKKQHNLADLKTKSAGFVWEFMFTHSMFNTADIASQGAILDNIADLLDRQILVSTLKKVIGAMTAENIDHAHQSLLSGSTIGKLCLTAIE